MVEEEPAADVHPRQVLRDGELEVGEAGGGLAEGVVTLHASGMAVDLLLLHPHRGCLPDVSAGGAAV